MKFVSILLLTFFPFLSFSMIQLTSSWTQDYQYVHSFQCENDDSYLCQNLCQNDSECHVVENFCHNCVGTDLYLRSLFIEMGTKYQNSKKRVPVEEFFQFLKQGDFISLNSKSIYNLVDTYDSLSLRARFQTLCSFQDDYPIVFLETDASRFPGQVRYVVCQASGLEVYLVTNDISVSF